MGKINKELAAKYEHDAHCVYLMVCGAIANRLKLMDMIDAGMRPALVVTFRRHMAEDLRSAREQLLNRGRSPLAWRTFRSAYLSQVGLSQGDFG